MQNKPRLKNTELGTRSKTTRKNDRFIKRVLYEKTERALTPGYDKQQTARMFETHLTIIDKTKTLFR